MKHIKAIDAISQREVDMKKVKSIEVPISQTTNNEVIIEYKKLIASELLQDFLKIFLKNPYLKRPHIVYSRDSVQFILERTWHVFEEKIESVLSLSLKLLQSSSHAHTEKYKLQVIEGYCNIQKLSSLADLLQTSSVEFTGNEARKFSTQELNDMLHEVLESKGALLEFVLFSHEKQETLMYIFIPISDKYEFI